MTVRRPLIILRLLDSLCFVEDVLLVPLHEGCMVILSGLISCGLVQSSVTRVRSLCPMHLLSKGKCSASLPCLNVIDLQQIISLPFGVIDQLGSEDGFSLLDLLSI